MLEAAPYFADIAQGPEGACAYWIHADDGVRLRVGHFAATGAINGSVLMFPGRTEYIEKYGASAVDFAARGFHMMAIDWRGQGLADRLLDDKRLGHVEAFGDYQRDVAAMIEAARALDLPKPWFLVGHSMGGCIGLRALHEGLPVQAVAFSAPMWGIRLAPPTRPVAWALSHLAGWAGQGHRLPPTSSIDNYVLSDPFENNMLTRDPQMYEMMQDQLKAHPELALGGPSLVWLREALIETRALSQRAALDMPCVTYLGTHERIVDAQRIHAKMAAWPKGQLHMVAEAEHEVMMEIPATRERVFDGMADLFKQSAGNTAVQRSA